MADHLRAALHGRKISFDERKMMRGICYMADDKMCVGVVKNKLMARIDPQIYELALLGAIDSHTTNIARVILE